MIIVKTDNGTHFVNERETQVVQHDKAHKMVVIRSQKEGLNCNINNVTEVIFVSDAQAMELHDDGNIIEEMKAKMEQMEIEKLTDVLQTESECNAKLAKAESEKLRLKTKLRDFGCEL